MTFSRAVNWIQYNGNKCPPDVHPNRWEAMIKQIAQFFKNR